MVEALRKTVESLSADEAGLVKQIASCWKTEKFDHERCWKTEHWYTSMGSYSDWMKGMTISEDGTFCTKWDGKQHQVQDGRVRVVSAEDRRINLRRTCDNPNDHIFTVDADFKRMKGECPQSGCTFTLTRAAGVEESERWDDDSRRGDFTVCDCGHVHCGGLYHHDDGQCGCRYEPGEEYYCGFYKNVRPGQIPRGCCECFCATRWTYKN